VAIDCDTLGSSEEEQKIGHYHAPTESKETRFDKNSDNSRVSNKEVRFLTMNLFLRPIVTNDGNDYKEERL